MKIEKLRNNHKKEIIIGTILTVVIGGALTYKLTHSKYRVTQSIDLGAGVINYKVPDFKIMAMYKSEDGKNYTEMASTERMPGSGYVIDENKSYCNLNGSKDTSAVLKTVSGNHVVSNLIKGDKCYLYFKKDGKSIDNIIATIKASSSYKGTATPTFNSAATGAETEANNGIYATADGTNMYGTNTTTYYWRGAATTNHVIFAEKCWRIVRINGDKTMRLIYNGTVQSGNICFGNGENAGSIAVTSQAYNSSSTRNQSNSVGWTYSGTSQRTLSGTASNAKNQTESWYNSDIGNNSTYVAKVADGKFCNDRNVKSGQSWVSTGTGFQYAAYERLVDNKVPTFSCANSEDVYTLKVGAITADEVAFAGGVYGSGNSSFYLYNGQNYWTMSPFSMGWAGDRFATESSVSASGYINAQYVDDTNIGLRPVINLRSDTLFASNSLGTSNFPYIVQ